MSSEVIASFAVTGQPHVHDSHPLLCNFNPGLHLSVEAVGCEFLLMLLLAADTNLGSTFASGNLQGEQLSVP